MHLRTLVMLDGMVLIIESSFSLLRSHTQPWDTLAGCQQTWALSSEWIACLRFAPWRSGFSRRTEFSSGQARTVPGVVVTNYDCQLLSRALLRSNSRLRIA